MLLILLMLQFSITCTLRTWYIKSHKWTPYSLQKASLSSFSVEICLSVACASVLVPTSPAGKWPCAPTCCRGSSQSGPSSRGMKVKIFLESRWGQWKRCHMMSAHVVVVLDTARWIWLWTHVLVCSFPNSELCLQVEGCFPDTMTRCAELINNNIEVDFVDINSGCPIDLVYKKVKIDGCFGLVFTL